MALKSSSGPWFVYLIRRSDGGFLTGVTPDPAIRIHPHTGGRRARPIPGELPVTLVYTEEHPSEELATARDHMICERPG